MRKDLEIILNSTHDAMVAVNNEGIITLYNKAARRLTQKEHSQVLGKYILDIIPNSRLPVIIKTGKEELNKKLPLGDITIITNRMPVMDDYENIIGAVAVFRDITELDDLLEENTKLKEMQILLKAIFQSTQDAISVVDEKGMGIIVNPAYEQLSEMDASQLIGKPCTVDIPEGEESNHLKVLKTKKPIKNVQMKIGPNKKEVIVDVAPIIVNKKLKGSVAVIHDLSEIKRLTYELDEAKQMLRKKEAKYVFEDIIGQDPQIRNAVNKAKNAAKTPATVLLRGESGTGKELFAHAIHNESSRRNKPFIKVNCAALAENILESELFGYVEGAFTGAKKGGRQGLFERAHGGTIFLDELGEISKAVQIKLLRVLQEREITRVGGTDIIPIDIRVIAATTKNLYSLVKENKFREDLFFRLNVINIRIPPLRERKGDIMFFIKHFINKNHMTRDIPGELMDILSKREWRGNIRELKNCIQYMISKSEDFNIDNLPEYIKDDILEKNEIYTKNNNKEELAVLSYLRDVDQRVNRPGRKEISLALKNKGFNLSEYEMRNLLKRMEEDSLVKIVKGRGGTRITVQGLKVLNSY